MQGTPVHGAHYTALFQFFDELSAVDRQQIQPELDDIQMMRMQNVFSS
jgi:hypothetical protein